MTHFVLKYDFGDYEIPTWEAAISALARIVAKEIENRSNSTSVIMGIEHLLDVADTITLKNLCEDWIDQLKDYFEEEARDFYRD